MKKISDFTIFQIKRSVDVQQNYLIILLQRVPDSKLPKEFPYAKC